MPDIRVVHGDCVVAMRAMDDACVDAIVTDPPYELSDDGKASANRVAAEMLFPQHPHIKALAGGECHLVGLMLQIVGLGGVGLVPTPAATVPVGTVALNEDASVRKVEIEDMGVLASGVAHSNGTDGLDADAVEHIGDFAFELGSAEAALNALDAAGCGFCAGSIGVGFRVSAAGLPSLLRSGGPVPLGRNDIGALNNALARLVCTFGATENEAVARLQVGSASEEWLAASAALKLLAVALLAGAKLVRTGARTSRLPAMLEPRRICVVSQATGRAISFNLLIHKQIVTSKGFMGKSWDGSKIAYDLELWTEALRVLKPGGHLLAFSGTRTYHRMVCAIEDAGFEVRDQIGWLYGSGFPKSLDVSKAIDKAAGAEREVIGEKGGRYASPKQDFRGGRHHSGADTAKTAIFNQVTAPATPEAQQWAGWGTALKPSHEPVCIARKPLGFEGEWVTIAQSIGCLWSRLWSLLPASAAAQNSVLSPSVYGVDPSVSARWSAEQRSSTQAALCGQMDMSQFVSAVISSLNTVSSWNSTLAALWSDVNTSITGTKSSMTTDLRTLRCCLSAITPESIIMAHKSGAWSNADACNAARYLSATVATLNATRELSALAPAIDLELQRSLAVVDGLGWNSICVARKPLVGTVAANVLEHGTGALNIDACRVGTTRGVPASLSKSKSSAVLGLGVTAGTERDLDPNMGRWPANVIHDGSDEVLEAFAAFERTPRCDRLTASNSPAESRNVCAKLFTQSSARSAATSSQYSTQDALTALTHAVTQAGCGEIALSDCLGLGEIVTESSLMLLCETVTTAIRSIGGSALLGQPLDTHIQTNSRASAAVQTTPTGTTKITISHWKSDGSADPVTCSITPTLILNGARSGTANSAARFFMSCKPSAIEEVNGALVWLLWHYKVDIIVNNSNGVDKCPSTNAQHAEPHSPLSLLPTSNIAQSGATASASSKIGQSANSAASLFGSCATPTVPNPARARIKTGSDLTERFTSATASELRRLSETLTTVIQSIESACSRGSQPTKLSLTLNHAECVATREPTGTTQITISHWRSSGCAEPVTFSITPKNSVPGVAGSPSRFIYSAKASKQDRAGSKHPTVKPVALIEYLAKLVTPPGGTVLDPFAGSGTLAVAASRLGFNAILIEREAEYVAMIHGRLDALRSEAPLVAGL